MFAILGGKLLMSIATKLNSARRYWFPPPVDRNEVGPRLSHFYATHADYHAMTAIEDKVEHCQVQLLLDLLQPTDHCVEFGCGGGVVLELTSQKAAHAIGIDIAPEALKRARSRPGMKAELRQGDVANTGLPSSSADFVYSFEVLEHIWDPDSVVRDMARVLKPGGRMLLSTPNGFSLDLQVPKRRLVRIVDFAFATVFHWTQKGWSQSFKNMNPDLDAQPVYPDCDMITKICAPALARVAATAGIQVERIETNFFIWSYAGTPEQKEECARRERHWLYHHYGDHILLFGRKY